MIRRAWYVIQSAFEKSMDLSVDVLSWMRSQGLRRKMSANAVSHRWSGEEERTVWHILGRNEDTQWIAGQGKRRRDDRGWRYSPMVWHLVTRLQDERASFDRAAENVWHLLNEMQGMIMFPPSSATESEHGCANCTCNAVPYWKAVSA